MLRAGIVCGLQAPHCVHMRAGTKFGDVNLVDTMMKDGLIDAFNNYHMGLTGGSEEGALQICLPPLLPHRYFEC